MIKNDVMISKTFTSCNIFRFIVQAMHIHVHDHFSPVVQIRFCEDMPRHLAWICDVRSGHLSKRARYVVYFAVSCICFTVNLNDGMACRVLARI